MAHHYELAVAAIDRAVQEARESGWTESDLLQSLIVAAAQGHARSQGAASTSSLLHMQLANLRDEVDFDFVRAR